MESSKLIVRIQDDSSIKPLYIVHKSAWVYGLLWLFIWCTG